MKPSSWVRMVVFAAFCVVLIGLLVSKSIRMSHHDISDPNHILHNP